MRIALIFAIFAPIRLCSFGGNDIGWVGIDTWGRGETGFGQDAAVGIDQPVNMSIVEPGQEITFIGNGDFVGAFPEDIQSAWIAPNSTTDTICGGRLDANGVSTCTYTIPSDWQPGGYRFQFQIIAPWGQFQDTFVTLVIEPDDPDPTGPPALTIGSPTLSSRWSESSPVPFVATLRGGETPLVDARIVWEVDGLQVAGLTARTDANGTIVRAASFEVGPHEALATVFVDSEPVTASTRFTVTADDDPDTDTDSDFDSDSGTETSDGL